MGCFLLTDYMVELGSLLDGCVALELGAGTGISSIASGILTNVRKTFCTGMLVRFAQKHGDPWRPT